MKQSEILTGQTKAVARGRVPVISHCFVWTQSQVKISFSFLLLIQEKLGGSEMQITVIKKNTWQRNMDAMCQCTIVSNLETLQKDQRSNNIVTWSKWRMAANGRVGGAGKIYSDFLMIAFWNHFWLIAFSTVSFQRTMILPSALNPHLDLDKTQSKRFGHFAATFIFGHL